MYMSRLVYIIYKELFTNKEPRHGVGTTHSGMSHLMVHTDFLWLIHRLSWCTPTFDGAHRLLMVHLRSSQVIFNVTSKYEDVFRVFVTLVRYI